jgi:putative ABC transport system permease protein
MYMLKNYFKVIWRNIRRHKLYSFINIAGLVLGITACLLISFYVKDELSHDLHYKDADRIYRIVMNIKSENINLNTARTSNPLSPVLKESFPQVENSVRLRFGVEELVHTEDLVQSAYNRKFYEKRVCYAGPEIFDVFSINLIEGNPETALDNSSKVVITERMAQKYFPGADPLGKVLMIKNKKTEVTGVIKNVPGNSHLKYDFIASFDIKSIPDYDDWAHTWFYTYVKLKKNVDIDEFAEQIKHIADKYYADKLKFYGVNFTYSLQPVRDIHLHSKLSQEIEEPGSSSDIIIFSIIAMLILLIACLNFINLSTISYSNRIKEIGIRKVVGASRAQLIKQFIGESIFYCCCALIITPIAMEAALPWFNEISGKAFTLGGMISIYTVLSILGIILFIGITAGSFPAFILSSFKPAAILSAKQKFNSGKSLLRKILVVTQFTISIVLIAGTVLLFQQVWFLKNQKLGFDKDQIVVLPMREAVSTGSYKFLKDEFVKNPSVISASITWSIPGRANIGNGDFTSVDNPQFKDKLMKYMFVDSDFQNTYGILLAGGRSFQKKFSTDENAYMVNETAMKAFGWSIPDEAVGKNILGKFHGGGTGQIIGVYKNFHFESLKNLIEPLVIKSIPEKEDFYETNSFLNLKLNSKNIAETMSFIQNKWKELFPQAPYDYFFLNEDFNLQYSYDEKICRIILSFSILAIFIACLGLYGLILFSAEQKTKEIGIRKVLGASVRSVILLLAKEFIVLVISANIIAWPIAWFVMNQWLQNFAYRIDLTLWPFLLAGLLALVIALFTVSWQVIHVATANPVESLRYE